MPIVVTLPIKTVVSANAREHWARKAQRAKKERRLVAFALKAAAGITVPFPPLVVTFTRGSAGEVDDDNLPSAMKALRDGVADFLGVDDKPGQGIEWRYAQERTKRGIAWVRVEIARPDVKRGAA